MRRTCPTCGKGGYRAISEYQAYKRFEQMCEALEVTSRQMKSSSRVQAIVRPRRLIMVALFEDGVTIWRIAEILNKNRNAVHWAIKSMRKELASSFGNYWRASIDRIKDSGNGKELG